MSALKNGILLRNRKAENRPRMKVICSLLLFAPCLSALMISCCKYFLITVKLTAAGFFLYLQGFSGLPVCALLAIFASYLSLKQCFCRWIADEITDEIRIQKSRRRHLPLLRLYHPWCADIRFLACCLWSAPCAPLRIYRGH